MTKDYPLHLGKIMVHEKSGMKGKANATFYPDDNRLENIKLTLVLKDGTEREFRYLELRKATEKERSEFYAA
jgi:hypothetical protein